MHRLVGLALAAALIASGCATTQEAAVTDKNYCPFLGNAVCARLVEGKDPSMLSSARPTSRRPICAT